MKYQVAHHSLVGTRSSNQDRVGVAERENAVLLVLGDGLGGHAGGALAAETLVQVALRAFNAIRQPVIANPSAFLALTIMQAHNAMRFLGGKQNPPIQPRTTCVLCLVQNGYAYWAHVGDSRLYHFRDNALVTRTLDHTHVEQMHIEGVLTEDEMVMHPAKSSLLKCLGSNTKPSITLGPETPMRRNDTLLLCSDGLWEAFTPEEITQYLKSRSLEEAVEQMVFDAEDKRPGRCDNTSAVCLRWEEGVTSSLPLQPQTPTQADRESILAGAAAKTVRQQAKVQGNKAPARPRAQPAPTQKQSFDESIKELEDLLTRFGPKS